jgi:hypothetical protein
MLSITSFTDHSTIRLYVTSALDKASADKLRHAQLFHSLSDSRFIRRCSLFGYRMELLRLNLVRLISIRKVNTEVEILPVLTSLASIQYEWCMCVFMCVHRAVVEPEWRCGTFLSAGTLPWNFF